MPRRKVNRRGDHLRKARNGTNNKGEIDDAMSVSTTSNSICSEASDTSSMDIDMIEGEEVPGPVILYGIMHQGDVNISLESRGNMCTASALIALCIITHLVPREWTERTVGIWLKVSDCFYRKVIQMRRIYSPGVNHPHLTSDEVTHERNNIFAITDFGMGYRCIENYEFIKQGYLRARDGLMVPLREGLNDFFERSYKGFIVCASQTMAIFKCIYPEGNCEYCLLDSHSRQNFRERQNPNAFLLRCPTLNSLADALLEIYQNRGDREVYTLNSIEIENGAEETIPLPDESFRFNSETFARPYNTRRSNNNNNNNNNNNRVGQRGQTNRTRRRTTTVASAEPSVASELYLGKMDKVCEFCGAKKFQQETISCCKDGQVRIPIANDYPDFLKSLLTGDHPNSKHFIDHIRAYNSTVAMASVAANYDVATGRGPPIIKINGIFHHNIGDVTRNNPQFGSVYICSGAADASCDNPELNPRLLEAIRQILRQRNNFVQLYKQMGELIESYEPGTIPDLHINFYLNPTVDRRRYNAPTDPTEVGAVFFSGDGQVPALEDNCLKVYYVDNAPERLRNNNVATRTISKTSPISDPLCYPILFPNGELGWNFNLNLTNPQGRSKKISMCQFYVYHFQIRDGIFFAVFFAGRLVQQFFLDTYVKIEGDRLSYIRLHQQQLRAESYDGVLDYYRRRVDNDEHLDMGRVIILPSSFHGGHRYMIGTYQDSMAMVAKFGKPTFFITMTCNPKWREITENIGANQIPTNRPDIVVRVFREKLKALMAELTKDQIFGKVVAWVYVIEFQKRGLPHAHICLTVDESERPKTPEEVDKFVCCELPDKDRQPELYKTVVEVMLHGPCGEHKPNAPCMDDGKCKKKFPYAFTEETVLSDSCVTYRRRNTGTIQYNNRPVDNSWVIPYNPYLLLKYKCHINVLYVKSVGCVKYLFKYITKGHDAALYRIEEERRDNAEMVFDEINQFVQSRYISANEAAYRIFKMPMHEKSHAIVRLPIHLPNERTVYFRETDDPENILDIADNSVSLLEEYFKLNSRDEFARTLSYVEIPEHYVFRNKSWHRRQRNIKVLGRIYTINPRQVEKFHLRVLLLHVKGAISFEDLMDPRDGDPSPCTSFHEAARRRLLIGDDDLEWERTLEECVRTQVAGQCRKIFCYMLNFCDVLQPRALYNKFRLSFIEDYLRRGLSEDEAEKRAVVRIERFLSYFNVSLSNYGMGDLLVRFNVSEALFLEDNNDGTGDDPMDIDEDDVHINLMAEVIEQTAQFNVQQQIAFETIWNVLENFNQHTAKCFYLQGAGGTGKTFVYNVLLQKAEASGIPCLAVAHTGIAALLLRKGRTAHSTFRLPLDIHEDSTSSITRGSQAGRLLQQVKLIVWDEISMTTHYTINVVDRLLRDLHGNDATPFGGVCILFGGDLRQLLPVNNLTRAQIENTFMNCRSWHNFRIMELTQNMRADPDAVQFADWLIELGDGTLKPHETIRHLLPPNTIEIPQECVSDNVVEEVYGDIFDMSEVDRLTALSERMVLCSLNQTCDTINDRMIERFPGESIVIFSNDSIETDDVNDKIKYQEEVLNTRKHTGLPHHKLILKVGIPIILLRNISMEDGLVNGTRLVVRSVSNLLLTGEIICGTRRGQVHTIPRMDLSSRDSHFPFTLKRRQFPVKACFAMTINKSQGQSFQRVGIYLPQPVFAFGQLYVAFSRCKRFDTIRVQVETGQAQGKMIIGDQRVFTRNMAPMELLERLRQQLNNQ